MDPQSNQEQPLDDNLPDQGFDKPQQPAVPPSPDPRTDQQASPTQAEQSGPEQQPAQPASEPHAPVVMGGMGASPTPRTSKKRLLLLCSGIVLILALATGGVVFGYYVPNKPENVWKTGLDRTGEALKKTTESATDKSKLDAFSKSDITATAEMTGNGTTYSGKFASKFDKTKADGSLDFTVKADGQSDRTFGLKFLGELKEGSMYPSLYLQLSGLKTLGIDQFEQVYPGISEYDGKWIAIEEDYLRSLAEQTLHPGQTQPPAQQKKEDPITADDIAQFARTAADTISEYMLTSKPDKAVFEQRSFVGKETMDGMKTYHYKVGVNKQHAKDFCKAFTERMWATNLYKKAPGGSKDTGQEASDKARDDAVKRCQESADQDKQDETFDLWVDGKYKLIHKIRVTDEKDSNIYTELGQSYKGGNDVSLFMNFHDGTAQTDGALTLDSNMKTIETKAKFTFKSTKQDDAYDVTVSFEAKPLKDDIKVEKPAGAVPVKDIFDRYQIDPSGSGLLGLRGVGAPVVTQELSSPLYLN